MKQIIFCSHDLVLKSVCMTDVTVRQFDCITPQKTQLEIPLTYDVKNNDIIIIKDQATKKTEYIGIIDTVSHEDITTVLAFPFEQVFDNECILSDLDGNIYDWIVENITNNYISTGDRYNDYTILFENHLTNTASYKMIVESNNLLDNLNNLFLNTGIYLKFSIGYNPVGLPESIIVGVYNANEQDTIQIRYDNPIVLDNKVLIENSHTGNSNKAIIRIIAEDENQEAQVVDVVKLYLKENNTITTNPEDEERIKQVKTKIIDYKPSNDEITEDEQGEAIILLAERALCGNSFDHSIEFTVVLNDGYIWEVNKRCNFISEDRIYYTYVTSIEYLDKRAKIKLGAYRYTLTDRFKALRKKEIAADSIKGIPVTALFENSMFWFTQDASGNIYLNFPDTLEWTDEQDQNLSPFTIENGHLIFTYEGDEGTYAGKYVIDDNGHLSYNL